ncbi:MAG: hypothetical protein HY907_15195 [Deltaproteobacteria bacterium]|nr:hypothetical protein [Deltaproteobacteria bacterium]
MPLAGHPLRRARLHPSVDTQHRKIAAPSATRPTHEAVSSRVRRPTSPIRPNRSAASRMAPGCGNAEDCAGCRGDCSAAETGCGDGLACGAAACDDGNAAAGDGCSDVCAVETGYTCAGEPSACTRGAGSGGCGCRATGGGPLGGAAALLGLLALLGLAVGRRTGRRSQFEPRTDLDTGWPGRSPTLPLAEPGDCCSPPEAEVTGRSGSIGRGSRRFPRSHPASS